jgi:hypothetical protein
MKTALLAILLGTLAVANASSGFAQSKQCPSGQHYDTKQQKCVKHGD